ncbi:MAG: response regulator, partial [Candidatus Dojkabacteria bacterium]
MENSFLDKKIIAIDDDYNSREILVSFALACGFLNFRVYSSAEEFMHSELPMLHDIDLLITDHFLGRGMDGYTLASRLKRAGFSFPILIFTATELVDFS